MTKCNGISSFLSILSILDDYHINTIIQLELKAFGRISTGFFLASKTSKSAKEFNRLQGGLEVHF